MAVGVAVGLPTKRLGVFFAIVLAGCAFAVHVGSNADRRRALQIARMPMSSDLKQAREHAGRTTAPEPTQDVRKVITDAETAHLRAPIADEARRPGGQSADLVTVASAKVIGVCWIIAALSAAVAIWVGIIHHTGTALLIVVTGGLIAAACGTSVGILSCSPAAIYQRSRPGKGFTLRFREIDTIGLIVGNQPARPVGLIVRAGEQCIMIPRQRLASREYQPLLVRLLRCDASMSLDAMTAILTQVQRPAADNGDATP